MEPPRTKAAILLHCGWWLVLTASIFPVWSSSHLPTLDGPAHLYTARSLDWWMHEPGILAQYYELILLPWPNWLAQGILLILGPVTGWVAAQKILFSLTLLALPLAFRHLLKSIDPHFHPAAPYLILPFCHHHLLYLGFTNFSLGLSLMLLSLGWFIGTRKERTAIDCAILGFLFLLLYFAHPIPYAFALLAVGIFTVREFFYPNAERASKCPLHACTPGLKCGACILPSLILFGWFLSTPKESSAYTQTSLIQLTQHLLRLDILSPFSGMLLPLTVFFSASCLIAGGMILSKRPGNRKMLSETGFYLLILSLVSLFINFLAPDESSGGSIIQYRITIIPWVFYLAWLSCHWRLPSIPSCILAGSMALLSLGLTLQAACFSGSFQTCMADYEKPFQYVEHDRSLLVVDTEDQPFSSALESRTRVFEHAHLLAGIPGKRIAQLDYYQAHAPGFPFRFRPESNPHRHLGYPDIPGSTLDVDSYEKHSGLNVDYILVQGPIQSLEAHNSQLNIVLHSRYEKIHESGSPLELRLFRRK